MTDIIMFFAGILPFYRAFQDAGIDMIDTEGIISYLSSLIILRMES